MHSETWSWPFIDTFKHECMHMEGEAAYKNDHDQNIQTSTAEKRWLLPFLHAATGSI